MDAVMHGLGWRSGSWARLMLLSISVWVLPKHPPLFQFLFCLSVMCELMKLSTSLIETYMFHLCMLVELNNWDCNFFRCSEVHCTICVYVHVLLCFIIDKSSKLKGSMYYSVLYIVFVNIYKFGLMKHIYVWLFTIKLHNKGELHLHMLRVQTLLSYAVFWDIYSVPLYVAHVGVGWLLKPAMAWYAMERNGLLRSIHFQIFGH